MTGLVEIEMDLFVKEQSQQNFSHLVEHHEMRAYTMPELSQAALVAGLSIVATGKWMELDLELSSSDWYGWLVCKPLDVER